MKKRIHIFIFFSMLMAGYSCQIARYCIAANQYSTKHTYTKGLTKKVVANVNPSSYVEKKLVFEKKGITLNYNTNTFDLFSIISFSAGSKASDPDYFSPSYFSPYLFSSGKRGPPALA